MNKEEAVKLVVSYDRNRVLGKGQFAFVYEGLLESSIRVAVKRIQKGHFNNFPIKKNIKIMQKVGHHSNIVSFIGYCDSVDFL